MGTKFKHSFWTPANLTNVKALLQRIRGKSRNSVFSKFGQNVMEKLSTKRCNTFNIPQVFDLLIGQGIGMHFQFRLENSLFFGFEQILGILSSNCDHQKIFSFWFRCYLPKMLTVEK